MTKKLITTLPFLCFAIGIFSSFIWQFSSENSQLVDNDLTYDRFELFKTIVTNNLLVCLIIILGFLTLGVSSLAVVLYNGYIFGICLQALPIEKIPLNFLSYSILESLGFILSCHLALYISSIILKNLVKNLELKVQPKIVIKRISYILALIFVSSIIEVYVSIN